MQLAAYLDRIGFEGEPAVDTATLAEIQRRHVRAIPYENLDVMLGRTVVMEPAAAFAKLVGRRRGGWCYEMNGLLGWALGEIGFAVTRLASGVMREADDSAIGNHLVLRIDLDGRTFLADAGLGDGPLTPYAVEEGPFTAGDFAYRLEPQEGGWWRLHNRPHGRPPHFDFHLDRADEALMASKCVALQSEPDSGFTQNLICQRWVEGGHVRLFGRMFGQTVAGQFSERTLASADELCDVLATEFAIDEPAAAALWPRICARHDEIFGTG